MACGIYCWEGTVLFWDRAGAYTPPRSVYVYCNPHPWSMNAVCLLCLSLAFPRLLCAVLASLLTQFFSATLEPPDLHCELPFHSASSERAFRLSVPFSALVSVAACHPLPPSFWNRSVDCPATSTDGGCVPSSVQCFASAAPFAEGRTIRPTAMACGIYCWVRKRGGRKTPGGVSQRAGQRHAEAYDKTSLTSRQVSQSSGTKSIE